MRPIPLIMVSILFLTCSASSAVEDGEAHRVGVSLSLTGEYSESGRKALAGVRLRIDDHNAALPAGAKRIELVVRDDKSEADSAAENVAILAESGVPVIIGPLSTGLMLAMRPELEKHGVVLVSPSATSPRIGRSGDWAFRVLFDDEFQGIALARFLAERAGMKRAAAIINDKFAYADSMFAAFAAEFSRLGGTVTKEEHYSFVAEDEATYDFTPILERVAQSAPDTVLLPLHSAEIADIVRRSTGMGLPLRFCGGDTWQHENILLSGGNNLENAYFVGSIDYNSGTPEMRHFIYLYDHSNDTNAQLSSVMGYDAASVVIEGLKNGDTGEKIKEGLYAIRELRLATGVLSVNPVRGSEKSAYIHRINMVDGDFKSAIVDEIKPIVTK